MAQTILKFTCGQSKLYNANQLIYIGKTFDDLFEVVRPQKIEDFAQEIKYDDTAISIPFPAIIFENYFLHIKGVIPVLNHKHYLIQYYYLQKYLQSYEIKFTLDNLDDTFKNDRWSLVDNLQDEDIENYFLINYILTYLDLDKNYQKIISKICSYKNIPEIDDSLLNQLVMYLLLYSYQKEKYEDAQFLINRIKNNNGIINKLIWPCDAYLEELLKWVTDKTILLLIASLYRGSSENIFYALNQIECKKE